MSPINKPPIPREEPESGIPAPGAPGIRIKVPRHKALELEAEIEGKKIERWQIISAVVGLVGTLLTSCAGGTVALIKSIQPQKSATSDEIAALEKRLASTEEALSKAQVGQIVGRLDKLDERFSLWQKDRDAEKIEDRKRDSHITFLAEFSYKLNGAAPTADFPTPHEGEWTLPVSATKRPEPPQLRTSRAWDPKTGSD